MAFRSSEYLQRNELVRYQLDDVIRSPGDNQHQVKNGYKFTINDRSSFYDWYNTYFEVQFQLQKLADGDGYADADRVTVINNSHSSSIGDGGSGPCCAKNPTQKNVPKTPPRKKPV